MTSAMPLILDDSMGAMAGSVPVGLDDVDVDDVELFGDPVVDLALPPHLPPSKQLQLRVDEQRIRGCCQRIGWSKQGTIASIAADGHSIELRYLRTNPEDGSWGLSEPTSYAQFSVVNTPTTFVGGPIVHLAWAPTGHPELAVIDSVGRVSILVFSISLNRPFPLRSWETDPIDDLHAVVGCYWLPIIPNNKQYNIIHGPAHREDHGYRYDTTFVHAFGPYHPNSTKSALLCVTASGMLRLFFFQQSNAVHDTSIELESITSSDDLATHASICSEKGTLLIALVTASRQLKVIRAAINWNLPSQDKQMPPHAVQLNPLLQQKPAAVTTWLQHGVLGETQLDISSDQISHIEVLPSALAGGPGHQQNQQQQPWAPPVVLTVRTYVPTPATLHYSPECQSIVDRWELLVDAPPPPLHPAFEQLGIKPPQSQANNNSGLTRLHKLEPIVFNKAVVSLSTIQHGRVVAFAFSDGTVQYRDRFTMEEIYNEPSPARFTALQQINFQFTDPTPCISAALSPTNCSLAQVNEDGKVKWSNLTYQGPGVGSTAQDPEYAAVIAGLATTVSTASFNQASFDDILSIARQFIERPRLAYDWMMEIVRMLKINVDYSEESHHDQLVRNHSLHLCLSILNHLGFRGEFKPRAFCGKFAMLALNVRNIVILITIASNTPSNLKEKLNPLDEPDVVDALAGCAKWALDLLAYIADCVFDLLGDRKFMGYLSGQQNYNELIQYLLEKNEVALHLLLCSSTRGFLSAACRRLLHLDSISTRATQYYELQQQQQAAAGGANGTNGSSQRPALILSYQKMQQYTSSSLIKVQEFDKLLWSLGEQIRQTYQSKITQNGAAGNNAASNKKNAGQAQAQSAAADSAAKRLQAHCELTLLLANNPPPAFQPLLLKFFNENIRAFRAMTDPAKLHFADYRILEVEDDEVSLRQKRERGAHIDVFKRVELLVSASPPPPRHKQHQQNQDADDAISLSNGPVATGHWRRCARCASVMEDVTGIRPGYTFVLAQQRKCSCSGNWGLLPRGGDLVG